MAEVVVLPDEALIFPQQGDTGLLQIGQAEALWQRLPGVHAYERMDATTWAAADDAHQPPDRLGTEVEREIGDHQNAVRLRDRAGVDIVLLDGLKLIPQILLGDGLPVAGQIREPLFDGPHLRPAAAGH